jgi:hypothetical protein
MDQCACVIFIQLVAYNESNTRLHCYPHPGRVYVATLRRSPFGGGDEESGGIVDTVECGKIHCTVVAAGLE